MEEEEDTDVIKTNMLIIAVNNNSFCISDGKCNIFRRSKSHNQAN